MLISSGDAEYITDPYGNVVSACHDGDYYVYSSDIQGSTECITEGENIAAEYEYSDFGEMTSSADEDFFNDICYVGAVYDEATGMYYMGARYYEPDTGRFITQDTYRGEISDSSTWHLYAYCNNDPVNYTDPSGHRYKSLYVSERMYSLALSKHKYEIDLARYPALNGALISRFKHSKTFTKFISNELKVKKPHKGVRTRLKGWTTNNQFGYGSLDDTDLSLSLGHVFINIRVIVNSISKHYYKCNVSLAMRDIYDFDYFRENTNICIRFINNNFGYKPQEKNIIHKYFWRYSCSFTKKYRRR